MEHFRKEEDFRKGRNLLINNQLKSQARGDKSMKESKHRKQYKPTSGTNIRSV